MLIRNMSPEMLARLDSATRYPSIPTYHKLGDKGRLQSDLEVDFDSEEVVVTEKIDGNNARIILSSYVHKVGASLEMSAPLIGSRTELLTSLGDVVHNPTQGIVDAVRGAAQVVQNRFPLPVKNKFVVIFGEIYGGRIGPNARDYSGDKDKAGFRVFDVAHVPLDVLDWERERIASWREQGGQRFMSPLLMRDRMSKLGIPTVPELPSPGRLPVDVTETLEWLTGFAPASAATLDSAARGNAEGVVVRTPNRSKIAKIRFQDYRRTLR